jgi:hypothetical protein
VDAGGAMSPAADSGLNAALLQISQHAERIAVLDGRESGHFRDVSQTLARLGTSVSSLKGTVADHGQILASLDGLGEDVTTLAEQVASLLPPNPGPGYRPIPAVQWWAAGGEDRDKALARLRDWVQRIYRPHYGHLAAMLADCWEAHPLCLVQLDWTSELWSVLYLQRTRNARDLAAQAEFGTRILPAVSEQLGAETSRCAHRRPPAAANRWAGTR